MLAALLAILSTASAPADAAPSTARYAIQVSVVSEGVETVAARTLISEEGQAEISVSDGNDAFFLLNAELAVQAENETDADLGLFLNIDHGDHVKMSPSLTFKRGGNARMATGSSDYRLNVEISPITP
jgi:hypothetical protein